MKDIRRATRRQFWAKEKIRIVLEGVRGEESIAELCRREGNRFDADGSPESSIHDQTRELQRTFPNRLTHAMRLGR